MTAMCRFAAYTGKPIALGRLVDAPEHSLVVQSYRPREMPSGTIAIGADLNVRSIGLDGRGCSWHPC